MSETKHLLFHCHQFIRGWFDYEDLYSLMIEQAPAQAHFVEVGSYQGKSIAYLAVEANNSGKKIKLDAVDIFDWSNEESIINVGEAFDINMKRFGLDLFVNKIQMYSVEASKLYQDESLDFVFLDADHSYEAVSQDILHWLPKIKPGGFLGGHDYTAHEFPGVIQAVHELIGQDKIKLMGCGSSWLYRKD